MRIRMLTLMAGPEGIRSPGSVVELSPADAHALIDGGFAVAIDSAARVPVVETATDEPVREAAVGFGQRRRSAKS